MLTSLILAASTSAAFAAFSPSIAASKQQQSNAPWGLCRISNTNYQYNGNVATMGSDPNSIYTYEQPQSGSSVTVYILDTGVNTAHTEFNGRASWGANFVDSNNADQNGHGTHLAGIIAGNTVGVSRAANIVAVKVLDANRVGAISNFVKAVDWVIAQHAKNANERAIINYSAVGEISQDRQEAVARARAAGILFVNSAGNDDQSACTVGPANLGQNGAGALVVAALNWTNTPAQFSNYGSCVSVYAPGVDIYSSLPSTTSSYGYMSGTSNAAAFVSGLAAYFWTLNPSLSAADLTSLIISTSTNGVTNNRANTKGAIINNYI